jgi:acetolactate synthase-1/2/3 large subunit
MKAQNLRIAATQFCNVNFLTLEVGEPKPRAAAMFDSGKPELDWTLLAREMGVPAARVTSLDALGKAVRAGLQNQGPSLIEIPV